MTPAVDRVIALVRSAPVRAMLAEANDFTIVEVSDQLVEFTGRSRQEWVGFPIQSFMTDPMKTEASLDMIRRGVIESYRARRTALRTGESPVVQVVSNVRRVDGTDFLLIVTDPDVHAVQPVISGLDRPGPIVGVIGPDWVIAESSEDLGVASLLDVVHAEEHPNLVQAMATVVASGAPTSILVRARRDGADWSRVRFTLAELSELRIAYVIDTD